MMRGVIRKREMSCDVKTQKVATRAPRSAARYYQPDQHFIISPRQAGTKENMAAPLTQQQQHSSGHWQHVIMDTEQTVSHKHTHTQEHTFFNGTLSP